MITSSWVSRIKILINYFIGNEIFNKSHCWTAYIVCLFNGTKNNLLTCIPSNHIKKILPISLRPKTHTFFKQSTQFLTEKSVDVSFPIDRHFVFFSGWRTFFFNDCWLVGKKKPSSCTRTCTVNLFHMEKEDTKLISHNSSFPSPCVNWTAISLCNSTWCNTGQSIVTSSIHARWRKTWVHASLDLRSELI